MGRDGTPAREISFVSLVVYGPNSDSALTMGGYSLWNQAGRFPNLDDFGYGDDFLDSTPKTEFMKKIDKLNFLEIKNFYSERQC